MSYNVFYDSNRNVVWSTNADISDDTKTAEEGKGYTLITTDLTDIPQESTHYINSAKDTVVAKTAFDLTFNTLNPDVDAVVNVTGLLAGTEVFLDDVSQGTMSDTTLTLTATEPGTYILKFKKLEKINYKITIRTGRQS